MGASKLKKCRKGHTLNGKTARVSTQRSYKADGTHRTYLRTTCRVCAAERQDFYRKREKQMTTTVIIYNKHKSVTVENQNRAWDDKTDNWLHMSTVVIGAGELAQVYCSDTRRLIITENEA